MAEMQKDEFQFPDEMEETKGKPVDELEVDDGSIDVDIEIVDDTPPEDRNVEPLPNDIKEGSEERNNDEHLADNILLIDSHK